MSPRSSPEPVSSPSIHGSLCRSMKSRLRPNRSIVRRSAVAAHPADPAAGFLLGYHLWFTGAKDEAAKLFRRVTRQVRDNTIVERFLRELDAKVAAG